MKRERILNLRCKTPFCEFDRVVGKRGLCTSCYNIASEAVREGHVSWTRLEALGMSEPRVTSKKAYFLSAALTVDKQH